MEKLSWSVNVNGSLFRNEGAGGVVDSAGTGDNSWARLARASKDLHAQVTEQRRATAVFKDTISELDQGMKALDETCRRYQEILSRVNVGRLKRKTRTLGRMMDSAMS